MVTGTHALGVCADAIGLDADGLLGAGFVAAYLTIGAPPFDATASPRAVPIDDEHDAKLAFSCGELARSLGSKRFREAAEIYAPAPPHPGVALRS